MKDAKINDVSALGLTALLPLYIRATELPHARPLVRDEKSLEIVEAIDFDFTSLKIPSPMAIPSLLRARELDRIALSYLCRHPRAAVVNIGCGLDARFLRIDNREIRWYELDFPEVISLRRQFFHENERYRFLACSVMDFEWMDRVAMDADGWLFIAEGVLMFLGEADVRKLVVRLRDRFPGAELVFDAASRLMVRMSRRYSSLRSLGVAMLWGIRTSAELEGWGEGISLLEDWYYYEHWEERLGWQNLFDLIPFLRRSSRLLRYQLGCSFDNESPLHGGRGLRKDHK